jgi:hypothetical protein
MIISNDVMRVQVDSTPYKLLQYNALLFFVLFSNKPLISYNDSCSIIYIQFIHQDMKHGAVDEPIINKIIIVIVTRSRIKTDKENGVQQAVTFEVNWQSA